MMMVKSDLQGFKNLEGLFCHKEGCDLIFSTNPMCIIKFSFLKHFSPQGESQRLFLPGGSFLINLKDCIKFICQLRWQASTQRMHSMQVDALLR
jgi:hypothetical protein